MKGQDLIASAQVTKAQQGYFLKWLEIVDAYHETTGKILCDGVENGAPVAVSDAQGGFMDGITYIEPYHTANSRSSILLKRIEQSGIDPCELINGNIFNLEDTTSDPMCRNDLNIYEYTVNSINTGKTKISLGLTSFKADIDGVQTHRNFIIFLNIPLDYAIRLDKAIDGYSDGNHGKCLNFSLPDGEGHSLDDQYDSLTDARLRPAPTNSDPKKVFAWPNADNNSNSIDNLFALGIMLDY
jgi:hypothetical protein